MGVTTTTTTTTLEWVVHMALGSSSSTSCHCNRQEQWSINSSPSLIPVLFKLSASAALSI